jgi:ParB/RepB/Spo0J family partition protein
MTDTPQSQPIPLAAISPSFTNPRRVFKDLDQLGASINAVGVLQPILVRPWPAGREPCLRASDSHVPVAYEIVAGERRWRACAEHTDLDTIPAIVRDLTDVEALEIQATENEQRADVLPSERSAGYQSLIAAGRTVEQIAATLGKSPEHVRFTLELLSCPDDLLAAVDSGLVPPTVAQLVCRVPDPRQRDNAARCVMAGCSDPRDLSTRPGAGAGAFMGDPLSFRATRDLIAQHFQRELKGAPFKLADKKLLPGAGACTDCPKRVGNAKLARPDVFAGTRDDVCLDPRCYRWKCDEHEKQQAQRTKERAEKRAGDADPDRGEPVGGKRVPLGFYSPRPDAPPDPDSPSPPPAGPDRLNADQADRLNTDFTFVHRTNPAASRAAKEVGYAASRACLEYALNPTVLTQARLDALCDALGVEWAALVKKHTVAPPPPVAPKADAEPAPPKKKPPAKKAKGAGEKDARPYAYTATVHRGGNQRQFDVVAPSVGAARGRAQLQCKPGERIVSLDPMTEAAYRRVHGEKRKANKSKAGT